MAESVVIICGCNIPHDQDKIYGTGKRLANPVDNKKGSSSNVYRCTVCGKEKSK